MNYLLSQIWICLLLAAIIGGIIGWILRGGCKKKLAAIDYDWRNRYAGIEVERNELTNRLGNLDNISLERDQLVREVSSLRDVQNERDDLAAKLSAFDTDSVSIGIETADAQDSYDIEEIEGVGKGYGKKLREMGIATTTNLIEKCPDIVSMKPVIEGMNLEDWVISSWTSMADLMRVRGIGGQYAELLSFSDITSVQALANANSAGLAEKMKQVNEKEHRVKQVPDGDTIAAWIEHAKTLETLLNLS